MQARTLIAAPHPWAPLLWALLSVPALSRPAPAQTAASRAEVLVLGVYHMANPRRDVVNLQADDVLAPRRQAEIAELVAVLRRFQPTKIAVEAGFNDRAIGRRYADYLAGRHELGRNETEQIGFRLARELGHDSVYPVDADGEFPFPRVADYARANGRATEFDSLMAETRERVQALDAYLASHTVLETLLYLNDEDRVVGDLGHYYRLAHLGEPWNWAGADLVADWFRRNMRIYTNVVRLLDAPGERVLVVFGAGHLGWLRHAFASDPTVRLRKLAEFAR